MRDCTLTWEKNIGTIIKTAEKYLHESYAAVVCTIQPEWTSLQHVTWDTGDAFSVVEKMTGNIFASYFLWKDKNHITHRRNSKYDAGQYGRTGTPESSDIIKVKIPKLSAGNRGTNSGRARGRGILQLQPPPGARERKA